MDWTKHDAFFTYQWFHLQSHDGKGYFFMVFPSDRPRSDSGLYFVVLNITFRRLRQEIIQRVRAVSLQRNSFSGDPLLRTDAMIDALCPSNWKRGHH